MKMYSHTCLINDSLSTQAIITEKLGATIFRIKDINDWPFINKVNITFFFPDGESELAAKLKVEPGFMLDASA